MTPSQQVCVCEKTPWRRQHCVSFTESPYPRYTNRLINNHSRPILYPRADIKITSLPYEPECGGAGWGRAGRTLRAWYGVWWCGPALGTRSTSQPGLQIEGLLAAWPCHTTPSPLARPALPTSLYESWPSARLRTTYAQPGLLLLPCYCALRLSNSAAP